MSAPWISVKARLLAISGENATLEWLLPREEGSITICGPNFSSIPSSKLAPDQTMPNTRLVVHFDENYEVLNVDTDINA